MSFCENISEQAEKFV